MKTVIALILWFILFSLSWPLAVFLFFFLGFFWLILLPFRIVGFTLEVVFRTVGAILTLPFRVLKGV
ncbi:hypothetical protein [Marinoscillum sp. 108]|jgi:hypothetical protein|uniref:Inner membrane component domain-containing protein n=1 Tax=Marinoscillum luteum TaxID=861051 RepID=A0ABW7ND03_9BACT|nr:hypothetical protein [Marinoscillum sp. 108]VXD16390.1 conserved hypothetical protein [Marinoscillum sp. 108]